MVIRPTSLDLPRLLRNASVENVGNGSNMGNVRTEKIVHLSTTRNTQDEAQGDLRGTTNDDLHLVQDHPPRTVEGEIRRAPVGELKGEQDLVTETRERKRRPEERKLLNDRRILLALRQRAAQAVVHRSVSIFRRPANVNLGMIADFHMQMHILPWTPKTLATNVTEKNQTLEIEVVACRMKEP